MSGLLILTFHGVEDQNSSNSEDILKKNYTIEFKNFKSFLSALVPEKCYTLADIFHKRPEDGIVLTFDDGLISDYECALPLLNELNIKATFFVTATNIGKPGYCNDSQIRELYQFGMEIGSHGMTHNYLVTMPENEIVTEIEKSKIVLQKILGTEIISFAPVGGHYRNWMLDIAKTCKYKIFATMIPGTSQINDNFNVVKRNHIKREHNLSYFKNIINQDKKLLSKNFVHYNILKMAKNILGLNLYDSLKKNYIRLVN